MDGHSNDYYVFTFNTSYLTDSYISFTLKLENFLLQQVH